MSSIINIICGTFSDSFKFYILNYFKTGNFFIDTITTTIIISIFEFTLNYFYDNSSTRISKSKLLVNIVIYERYLFE